MADEAFVENFVRLGAVVNTTMRLADHTCPRSWIIEFGHFGESSRQSRRSLKTVQGLRPPLRGKLPARASKVGVPPAANTAKQGSWKKPVGENFEGTGAPHPTFGAPAGTTFGRPVLGENWKLSGLPVMMLNGRPEANSISGATVQLLSK